MRVRIDILAADIRSPTPTVRPSTTATRQQGLRRGRIESWWEAEVERLDELVDMLRRVGSDNAVIELDDGPQDVRIWLTVGEPP